MKFAPKTEEELRAAALAPAGEYDFEVLNAEAQTSKAGNQMIKVQIGLFQDGKIGHSVFDYLMEKMGLKLRHFCAAVGLLSEYNAGALTADMCIGQMGRVKVIQDNKGDEFPPKNVVKDYLPLCAQKPKEKTAEELRDSEGAPFDERKPADGYPF